MAYSLQKLAAGSYDLMLDGVNIGSVVQSGAGQANVRWVAELLEDLPKEERPSPFEEIEHEFRTLGEICHWLGIPEPSNRIPTAEVA